MRKLKNFGKKTGVILLIVCLLATTGHFNECLRVLRGKITAEANNVYEGEDEAPDEWVASVLYNFAKINNTTDYGRLRKTVVYTPEGRTPEDFDAYYKDKMAAFNNRPVENGHQFPLLTDEDPYWMEPYDFTQDTLYVGKKNETKKLYAHSSKLDKLDTSEYADYSGYFAVVGMGDRGCVCIVYNKIGGSGYGNLIDFNNPDNPDTVPNKSATDFNPSNNKITSFHQDYNVILVDREEIEGSQNLYNLLKLGDKYYRLQGVTELKGMPAATKVPDGEVDISYFPSAEAPAEYDFDALLTGKKVTVNGKEYAYQKPGYEPESDDDRFFVIEGIESITVGNQIHHGTAGTNWFGNAAGWIFEDDWGITNNTRAYHRDYIGHLYDPSVGYNVTFSDGENTLFTKKFKNGQHPVYEGSTPTKASDEDGDYVFVGWSDGTNTYEPDETLPRVEGKAVTYTAVFKLVKLNVTKTADKTSELALDETITYTVVVMNSGEVTLSDLTLSDTLVTSLTEEAFSLEPGSKKTITYEYQVTQADIDKGTIDNTVTVSGKDPQGNTVSATAEKNVETEDVFASLMITEQATPLREVSVGDKITYTAIVTNTGNVSVKDGVLEDDHVDLSDRTFALAPGESATFTYTYTVTQDDIDAGEIANVVTANATALRGDDPEETEAGATVTAEDAAAELSVTKSAEPAEGLAVGNTVTFTVVVKNTGNVSVTDGTLEDDLVDLDNSAFALAPGEEATFTYTYTVTQEDVDAGEIVNTVKANATAVRGDDPDEAEATKTVVTEEAAAELSVTKSADPTSGAEVGETITYTVIVKNTGNVSVTDGVLEDGLADLSDETFALAPGEEATFTYTYTVTQADVDAGVVSNTVTATAKDPKGNSITGTVNLDTETVAAAPEMTVELLPSKEADVAAGESGFSYQVNLANTGNVTIKDIMITDTLTGKELGPYTLAPGESATVNIDYIPTQDDVDLGSFENAVTAVGEDSRGGEVTVTSETAVVTTVEATPGLSITKTVDESANAVQAEDTINYTVTVKNTGNVTLHNVTLNDSLVTLKETFDLAPGETKTITYEYTVTKADVDAGEIVNVVKANGTAARGDDPDEVSATVTVIPGREALAIESETRSWTYDGETHTSEVYTVTYGGEEVQPDDESGKVFTLKTGDKLTITPDAAGVKDYDTGYLANNTFTYTIENETLYDNVFTTFGTLSIDKRTVMLTSESAEKVYDGTALTKIEVKVEGEGFVDGEVSDIKAEGSVSEVSEGEVANTIAYTCNASFKATNYTITKTEGTLKIEPKEAVLEWSDTEFPYDGASHQPTAKVTNLVSGDSCDVTVEGGKSEVGEGYVATATKLSNANYKLPAEATTTFEIYACTVTFLGAEGETLQSGTVPYGTIPVYKGNTPTKAETKEYTYEFNGWLPEVEAVSARETTYTAQFKAVEIPKPDKNYYLAEGGNASYEKQSGVKTRLVFKSDRNDEETFASLESIFWNGEKLPDGSCELSEGSLIVDLLPGYLDQLPIGEYTLTVKFVDSDKAVDAKVTITEKKVEPQPQTGDAMHLIFLVILLSAALAVVCAMVKNRNERKRIAG